MPSMACVIPPLFLLCLLLTTMSSRLLAVQTTKEIDSYGRDYYVFTPEKIDPTRTYWLVLEVGVFEGPTVGTQAHENSGSQLGGTRRLYRHFRELPAGLPGFGARY